MRTKRIEVWRAGLGSPILDAGTTVRVTRGDGSHVAAFTVEEELTLTGIILEVERKRAAENEARQP